MAEAFGIIAGAISIAAIFNNCVDCFGYIQMGRTFGRDFETCQIRLDLARIHLSRWGESVSINGDPRFMRLHVSDSTDKLAAAALWQILVLFSDSSKISKTFHTGNAVADNSSQELPRPSASLHEKLYRVFKKIGWALHQSGELQRLIEDISKIIAELDQLYPPAGTHQLIIERLIVTEVEDLGEEELQVISREGGGTDPVLEDAARVAAVDIQQGNNRTGTVTLTDQAKSLVGDEYSETAVIKGFSPKQASKNWTSDVNMSGKSRLIVGTRYGGRSIMDD
ncbi:hypothetical protein LTR17_021247 [Elasticomyces elasticus]|nr:hypothetical protein LTR17_021247 [Elasticomyces elasticus]